MRFLIGFALAVSLSQAAFAGPMDDLTDAQQKVFDAWQNVLLTQRKVLLLATPSTGYGMYSERTSNVFKSGDKIFTYVEPLGYGWKNLSGGMFEMNFVTDLVMKAENGDVVVDQKAFATNVLQSHEANMEFSMDFTLTLTEAPVGKYKIEYTIHDISSRQDSTFDQDIVVAD